MIAQKIQSGAPTLTPTEAAVLTATVPPMSDGPALSHATGGKGVEPMDVSRCNGLACVDVRSLGGSGTFITQWNGVWDLPASDYDCDYSINFWGNGKYYADGPLACGDGALYQYCYPNKTFAKGSASTQYFSDLEATFSPTVTFSIH
jgi:hypothetical protein